MRKTVINDKPVICRRCREPIKPGEEYHEVFHRLWTTNNFHTGCFYVVKPRTGGE